MVRLGRAGTCGARDVGDELGLAANARYVEHATLDSQKVIRLDELDGAAAPYFSMLLVHRRGEAWS